MIKLIYVIFNANDGEQHKDNDNNITKYLEFNKATLIGLAEKNYENIVEVLTNNAMSAASYNPTLSLSSSSTLPSPYNQSDTNGIEEP